MMEPVEQRRLTTHVLDVHIQRDLTKPPCRKVRERLTQKHASTAASVEDRVREHQLAAARPQIELDHVDADLTSRVERRECVRRRERARATVSDSLEDVRPHGHKMPRTPPERLGQRSRPDLATLIAEKP